MTTTRTHVTNKTVANVTEYEAHDVREVILTLDNTEKLYLRVLSVWDRNYGVKDPSSFLGVAHAGLVQAKLNGWEFHSKRKVYLDAVKAAVAAELFLRGRCP